ncbi:MAG: glucose-6-phosphate dehydrogenase [Limisphaerales bacterium]
MNIIPNIFVIFGGTGDLTWRMLVPALFDLRQDGRMPRQFAIIAVGRSSSSEVQLRQRFLEGVRRFSRTGKVKSSDWSNFAAHVTCLQGPYDDPVTYASVKEQCATLEKDWKTKACRIFHLATPPFLFGVIPKMLAEAGLNRPRSHARLVVEKPIGHDLDSARKLIRSLTESFHESQIFRIDHYLGKETVRNILAFRFAGSLFEPIWNRRYVDYVTITVAEKDGVEERGGYYDESGALRDMVQNHLMQLLCLVAMEPMNSFHADDIRNRKLDVLRAIRPMTPGEARVCAVRGQYGAGLVDGKKVRGYRREDDVSRHSRTETFAALKLFVDTWRWQDVPFYLRSGKRMPGQVSQIAIQFRPAPHRSFPVEACRNSHPSRLVLLLQPDEGIVLSFPAKCPGPRMLLQPVEMRFNYAGSFAAPTPNAYETLLWAVMNNDPTLFMRADQVEAAWEFLMPVFKAWAKAPPRNFPNYAAGTWGPAAADLLMKRDGRSWPMPISLTPQEIKQMSRGRHLPS